MRRRYDSGDETMRDKAAYECVSLRTIQRREGVDRETWLRWMTEEREEIRAMHDEEGRTWDDIADHYGLTPSTVRQRAYRARRERKQREEDEAMEKAIDAMAALGTGAGSPA